MSRCMKVFCLLMKVKLLSGAIIEDQALAMVNVARSMSEWDLVNFTAQVNSYAR